MIRKAKIPLNYYVSYQTTLPYPNSCLDCCKCSVGGAASLCRASLNRRICSDMKRFLLVTTIAILITGCSSYRGPVWVMQIESSPSGARIFSGDQPNEYQGTTPCTATFFAKAGGKLRGSLTIWAVPPTNTPNLHQQRVTFSSGFSPVTPPNALFFDLSKPTAP